MADTTSISINICDSQVMDSHNVLLNVNNNNNNNTFSLSAPFKTPKVTEHNKHIKGNLKKYKKENV